MENTIVLPGDVLPNDFRVIGPGLSCSYAEDGRRQIHAMRCGILRTESTENEEDPGKAWLTYDSRNYVPVKDDYVVGHVVQKLSDGWKVDVGSAELANVSALAFEGATKRNRPSVKVGDLIYGRVAQTIDPEIVCVSDDKKVKNLGALPSAGGWLVRTTPSHARKLLSPDCRLFHLLGEKIAYEKCTGVNGLIWVKAQTAAQTTAVSKAIELSRHLTNEQMKELVNRITKKLKS